jgi:hypothetical protein
MRVIAKGGSDSHDGQFSTGSERFAKVGAGLVDFAEF